MSYSELLSKVNTVTGGTLYEIENRLRGTKKRSSNENLFSTLQTVVDSAKSFIGIEDNYNLSPRFQEFTEALKINYSVFKINFSKYRFRDLEAEWLAHSLQINHSVTFLDLSYSELSSKAFIQIIDAIKVKSSAIRTLNLSHNSVDKSVIIYLFKALISNYSLSNISFPEFTLNDDVIELMASMIKVNVTLTQLYFSPVEPSEVSEKSIDALMEALHKNYSLVDWSTDNLKIPTETLITCKGLINRNRELMEKCHKAARDGGLDFLNFLRSHLERNFLAQRVSLLSTTYEEENTLLHWAVWGKRENIVTYLIEKHQEQGISVDSLRNKQGQSPLDIAFTLKHQKITQILLQATSWFDPDHQLFPSPVKNSQSKDEEDKAVAKKKEEWKAALKLTKDRRARYHELNKQCRTLRGKLTDSTSTKEEYSKNEQSYITALKELDEARKALMDAEKNTQNLVRELESCQGELKNVLIVKKRLENQLTEVTRQAEHLRLTRENELGIAIFSAVDDNNKEQVEKILDEGYSVNSLSNGATLLHHAVEAGSEEIIALLLERNVKLNRKNHNNETPLHRAVKLFNKSIVETLINAGADTTIPTENGTVVELMQERVSKIKREVENKTKALGQGLVMRDVEQEINAKNRVLKQATEILSLLEQANRNQDPNRGYFRAHDVIEGELAHLRARYERDLKKYPDMIPHDLQLMDEDERKIKQMLDPISLTKIDRELYQNKLKTFFSEWRKIFESHPAAKSSKSQGSAGGSSLSSPESMISRPSSQEK